MDTLGHSNGGTVGLFECHGSGGNQVANDYKKSVILNTYSCTQTAVVLLT